MAKASKTYVGPIGATEHTLADGRVIVPGEEFSLDSEAADDPHNKRLIEEGQILEVQKKKGGE